MALCLPSWHASVLEAKRRHRGRFGLAACQANEAGIVGCDPEAMRAAVERMLHQAGLYPPYKRLSMDVYAVARNIASEVGDGTPEEQVAIAEAAVNRFRMDPGRWGTIPRMMMIDRRRFARQRGTNPPVASRQDPSWQNLYVAELVLGGDTVNFARGATIYFDSVSQRAAHNRCIQEGRPDCPKSAGEVYESWTTGGSKMVWVGPLPGIDPRFLMLLRHDGTREAYQTPQGRELWQQMYRAGREALAYRGRDLRDQTGQLPYCAGGGSPAQRHDAAAAIIIGAAGALAGGFGVWAAVRYSTRRTV